MHELPVTQGILHVVLTTAQEAGAQRVTAVDLVIGDMSSIVDDSVQFYFDILSRDTAAEGATLRVRRTHATATCIQCGHQWAISAPLISYCPVCSSTQMHVAGGQEFYVESIEVDDESTGC